MVDFRLILLLFLAKLLAFTVWNIYRLFKKLAWVYRTLHSYKLFWAVCHLFPQRWRTHTYSVSGNHWPGGPRDMFKTRSARKFKSCVFEPTTRRVFSINTSSSNTLVFFDQISSQQQHTPFSVNQQERKATPWMGLAVIHIQGLWDALPSLRNCPFLTIKKGHFKLAILFVA